VRENQGEEQGERRLTSLARTQNTIPTYPVTHPNTNKHLANIPNKPDHLRTTQKHLNLAESGGKIRGENKVRKCDENCVEN
jgi:hypothetical protein